MTEESLRELVCALCRIDRRELTAESPLPGVLISSLGRARLDANLRSRFGVLNPAIYRAKTYGELCSVLGMAASSLVSAPDSPDSAIPDRQIQLPDGIGIGADVESIAAMPAASDYWEDDFYKTTFTAREIGHALLQPSPQASFAAMWCAKEAARKADAALAEADWQRIEVIHDDRGKPSIRFNGAETNGALSLSHTDQIAFAVFAHAPALGAASSARPASQTSDAHSNGQPETATHRNSNRSAAIMAALALLLSIAALALSFLRH